MTAQKYFTHIEIQLKAGNMTYFSMEGSNFSESNNTKDEMDCETADTNGTSFQMKRSILALNMQSVGQGASMSYLYTTKKSRMVQEEVRTPTSNRHVWKTKKYLKWLILWRKDLTYRMSTT